MLQKNNIPIPPLFLLLDLVGMLMAALGFAKLFTGMDVIPEQLRFEDYELVLIVAGIALTMPLIYHIVSSAIVKRPG